MNLLKCFYGPDVLVCHYIPFYQCIGFLTATAVNTVLAVFEPVKECHSLRVMNILSQQFNASLIKHVCQAFLPVRSSKFQLGSGTNHFVILFP